MRDQERLHPRNVLVELAIVLTFSIALFSTSSSLASSSTAQMYYSMGQEYMVKGDFDLAVLALGKAVELAPDWPEAHNALGEAYVQLLRFADGLAEFEKALELKQDYTRAKMNRRRTKLSVERYEPVSGSRLSHWHKFAILGGVTAVITLTIALVAHFSG